MLDAAQRGKNIKTISMKSAGRSKEIREFKKENLAKMTIPQRKAQKIVVGIAHKLFGFHVKPEKMFIPYIVDIYILEAKTAIEIDGGVHGRQQEYDEKRDFFLFDNYGVTVLRFDNEQVRTPYFKHAVWSICYCAEVDRIRKINEIARSKIITVHPQLCQI